ncbi:MAG: alpha/beta fold hydrolase [Propionibacteriaceae bacterium]|nr:alpha/beta fold hydrolase [Propionibacteriaceae bacterium]
MGGYGASFNRLLGSLQGDWDVWTVNPPGHGPSLTTPEERLDDLIAHYRACLGPIFRPDAVFFGHSMGAVVAYHVAAALADDPLFAGRAPSLLVLAASAAPRDLAVAGCADLDDDALLEHLRRFGAIPDAVAAERSLLDLFLPSFRADYRILDQARVLPPVPLDVPAWLVLGSEDPHTPAGTPWAWADYLADEPLTHVIPGAGHMFVVDPVEHRELAGLLDDAAGFLVGIG